MTRPIDLRKKGRGRAIPTYYDGRTYHSKREALYAASLDAQRHARHKRDRVHEWTPQVAIPLYVEGKLICRWVADFQVTFADGRTELHEVKGHETQLWILKRKLFEALYPGRALKVIR